MTGEDNGKRQLGEHTADIRSLHYRMDEMKEMLQQYHKDHQEDIERLDQKFEERIRPVERFKTGVNAITAFVITATTLAVAWLKARGLI